MRCLSATDTLFLLDYPRELTLASISGSMMGDSVLLNLGELDFLDSLTVPVIGMSYSLMELLSIRLQLGYLESSWAGVDWTSNLALKLRESVLREMRISAVSEGRRRPLPGLTLKRVMLLTLI